MLRIAFVYYVIAVWNSSSCDTKTCFVLFCRIHGRDERLSKSNLESALNFYYHLMLNANADWVAEDHSHSADL